MGWNYLSIPKLQRLYGWSWERINNFIPHFTLHVITFPCWDLKLNHASKWGPGKLCQKQVSRAGTSSYIPQILWDVITCPCPPYLLPAHFTYEKNSIKPYQMYVQSCNQVALPSNVGRFKQMWFYMVVIKLWHSSVMSRGFYIGQCSTRNMSSLMANLISAETNIKVNHNNKMH